MAKVHQISDLTNNMTKWEENGNLALSLNTRALNIIWGGEGSRGRYWLCMTVPIEIDEGKEILQEVAELLGVHWFEVTGKVPMNMLSSGTTYNLFVTLKIALNASGWKNNLVMFWVYFPGNSKGKSVAVDLSEYLDGEWIDVPDEGLEFHVPRDNSSNGMLCFGMYEVEGEEWKKGIVIKDVKFIPQVKLTTII